MRFYLNRAPSSLEGLNLEFSGLVISSVFTNLNDCLSLNDEVFISSICPSYIVLRMDTMYYIQDVLSFSHKELHFRLYHSLREPMNQQR